MAFAFADSYRRFEQEVKTQARYVYSDESNSFLREVISTCKSRQRVVPRGSIFARAQIGISAGVKLDQTSILFDDWLIPFRANHGGRFSRVKLLRIVASGFGQIGVR